MLPDLPGLKRDIQQVLDRYLQNQVHARLGVFNESPQHVIHEGSRMRTIRADGSVDESDLKEASAEMSLKFAEIPQLSPNERVTKLNNMADELANQIVKHLFGTLDAVLEKAGQVTNQKGKPLSADAIFEALEKIQLDFDEAGQHHKLSIVVPPTLISRAKEVFEQIESDPTLQKRYEEIITRKKLEWRDREAARKLVG